MKWFIFIRGQDSDLKRHTVWDVLKALPENQVARINMFGYPDNPKLGHRHCVRMVKQALQDPHGSDFLLIDNESLLPLHWQSYYGISQRFAINAVPIGIDIFSGTDEAKSNLQYQNCALFIASVYKYLCVKSNDDIPGVVGELSNTIIKKEKKDVVTGTVVEPG